MANWIKGGGDTESKDNAGPTDSKENPAGKGGLFGSISALKKDGDKKKKERKNDRDIDRGRDRGRDKGKGKEIERDKLKERDVIETAGYEKGITGSGEQSQWKNEKS